MLSIFKVFDVDGDGHIGENELKKVLAAVGQNLTSEQVKEIILAADTTGQGLIDYNDFVSFLTAQDDQMKHTKSKKSKDNISEVLR